MRGAQHEAAAGLREEGAEGRAEGGPVRAGEADEADAAGGGAAARVTSAAARLGAETFRERLAKADRLLAQRRESKGKL